MASVKPDPTPARTRTRTAPDPGDDVFAPKNLCSHKQVEETLVQVSKEHFSELLLDCFEIFLTKFWIQAILHHICYPNP